MDSSVELSIQSYFKSIQRLVDTGLVKKIQIHSAYKDMNVLDFSVEEMLYQFLANIKVPSVATFFRIRNIAAFNQWATNTLFLKELSLNGLSLSLKLSASIETLKKAHFKNFLNGSNLPNLKTLEILNGRIPDLMTDYPHLQSLSITESNEQDVTFMASICSRKNVHLKELSLDIESIRKNAERLRSCLMDLKPYLQKFAFTTTVELRPFWANFTAEFLQDNAVLKDFSVKYKRAYDFVQHQDVAYLTGVYRKLNLTSFSYTGQVDSALMETFARFVSTQTSLTQLNIHSQTQNNIINLKPLLEGLALQSVRELNLEFEEFVMKDEIKSYLEEFADACSVLEYKTMNLNGVPIGNVVRDLKVGLEESFVWISDIHGVWLKFISKEDQREFPDYSM